MHLHASDNTVIAFFPEDNLLWNEHLLLREICAVLRLKSTFTHLQCSSHSAVAFNHVLFIDLTVAAASYQGFAKFSVALSPGSNWSLPEANWLDSSDMSKSISQLNGAGRWRAFIATTAAACRLWPCGETEFQVSTFNSLPCLNVHGLLSTGCPRTSSSYVMWSLARSCDVGRC